MRCLPQAFVKFMQLWKKGGKSTLFLALSSKGIKLFANVFSNLSAIPIIPMKIPTKKSMSANWKKNFPHKLTRFVKFMQLWKKGGKSKLFLALSSKEFKLFANVFCNLSAIPIIPMKIPTKKSVSAHWKKKLPT